jgi:hypothetical protein
LRDNGFCNAVVDACFEVLLATKFFWHRETINRAFDALPQGSPFLSLMAHEVAYAMQATYVTKHIDSWRPESLKLAVTISLQGRALKAREMHPAVRNKCTFHIHECDSEDDSTPESE